MSSTKGKNDPGRNENDLYETPQWCVDVLAGKIADHFRPWKGTGLQIVDIGAGDGRIGRCLKERSPEAKLTMIDIVEPQFQLPGEEWIIADYLKLDLDKIVTEEKVLFVGNLPFSLADEMVFRTVTWTKEFKRRESKMAVVFLLRLNWLGSEKRARWVSRNSPTRLTVLAPRPSFCVRETVRNDGTVRKSSNDSCEYAWTWWESECYPMMEPLVEVGVWPLSRAERKKWTAEQRRKR